MEARGRILQRAYRFQEVCEIAEAADCLWPISGPYPWLIPAFILLRFVNGELTSDGALARLHAVEATCSSCGLTSLLAPGEGLTDLEGAGVMVCPHCQNHQAVSRMRLEEFKKRMAGTNATATANPSSSDDGQVLSE